MKLVNRIAAVIVLATMVFSASVISFAQTPETQSAKTRQRFVAKTATPSEAVQEPTVKPQDPPKTEVEPRYEGDMNESTAKPVENVVREEKAAENKAADVPEDTQANRHEQASEEAAIVPYYNNFFNTYRLGPEDIVSVNVFGQDRYSRSGIVIPPSGRIRSR